MSRSCRVFMTSEEWISWAESFCGDARTCAFVGELREWRPISSFRSVEHSTIRARIMFVPRERLDDPMEVISDDSTMEDIVFVQPPREEGDVLLMTYAVTRKLGPDALMSRMKRSLLKQAVFRTCYRGVDGGTPRRAGGDRCTQGAVDWYARGGKLRQAGVANIAFVPEIHL